MNMNTEVGESLNDSGIVEDIVEIKTEKNLSEYERIREENIKERLKMWEDLEIKTAMDEVKPKIFSKKRVKRKPLSEKNGAVVRKSARIANNGTDERETPVEYQEEDDDEDYDPKYENRKRPRGRPKSTVKPPKKLHYFENPVLVCSISFTAPASSKKLLFNYWA